LQVERILANSEDRTRVCAKYWDDDLVGVKVLTNLVIAGFLRNLLK